MTGAKAKALCGLFLMLAGGAHAQSLQECTEALPEVGKVVALEGGRLPVYRRGAPILLGIGAIVCTGDRPVATVASGSIDLDGEPRMSVNFASGHAPIIPSRERTLIDRMMGSEWWRPHLAGGTMGSEASGIVAGPFALVGLNRGTARIAARGRDIFVPLRAREEDVTISLFAPGAEKPLRTVRLAGGKMVAVFQGVPAKRGFWSLIINESNEVGRFEEAPVAIDDALRSAGNEKAMAREEAALAFSCLDPERNSLEAYQVLMTGARDDEKVAALFLWQQPTSLLSCATPVGPASN